jgi:hypothetical protein
LYAQRTAIITARLAPIGPSRSCIRNQSLKIMLKRTKFVLALPSYKRQRLSNIGRGWCPSRFLGECPWRWEGDPFRRWRSSPPVVECARFISAA